MSRTPSPFEEFSDDEYIHVIRDLAKKFPDILGETLQKVEKLWDEENRLREEKKKRLVGKLIKSFNILENQPDIAESYSHLSETGEIDGRPIVINQPN